MIERIYHRYEKWECYKNGFYDSTPPNGMNAEEAMLNYAIFLSDSAAFQRGIDNVFNKWKYSCEHFLTNKRINRIAWLGQASACIELSLPSKFRSGFFILNEQEQKEANELARRNIVAWESKRIHQQVEANGL